MPGPRRGSPKTASAPSTSPPKSSRPDGSTWTIFVWPPSIPRRTSSGTIIWSFLCVAIAGASPPPCSRLICARPKRISCQPTPAFTRSPNRKRKNWPRRYAATFLSRTLPTPSLYDVVWDTRSGKVLFASLGTKAVELFEVLLKQTFDGARLIPVHPFSRAREVLPPAFFRAWSRPTGRAPKPSWTRYRATAGSGPISSSGSCTEA